MSLLFQRNPAFAKEIRDDPGVKRVLEEYARRGADGARAVGNAIRDTGAYANSIRQDGTRVVSDDPGAMFIEFGSVNNPPFAPLRRGADATGASVRG